VYAKSFVADYSRLEKTAFTRERMGELHAVVIGAGALGNETARLLGLLGTGKVVVVDPDVVHASNLPRSVFFASGKTIGTNKAAALVSVAQQLFPDTEWSAVVSEIADAGFRRLAHSNVFFSCVDSDLARLEIAYIARKLSLPVVDAGLAAQNYSQGRVTHFPASAEHACFSCMLTPRKRRELLERWEATLRPCLGEDGPEELNSTPTMGSIIAALQVELGLRTVFEVGMGETAGARSYEIQIHPARRIEEFSIPSSVDCPFHRVDTDLFALPHENATFEDLLNSVNGDAIVLDWPICTDARCIDCDQQWRPLQRVAALRRRGLCPSCGSRHVLELQTIRTIDRDSLWLRQQPSALQLPADHLYSVAKRRTS
jgi:molybdopterin-synthase adenylyltransferase